jgi:hypothetical protein
MEMSVDHSEKDEQAVPSTRHIIGGRWVSWVISLTIATWIATGSMIGNIFITPGDPATPTI